MRSSTTSNVSNLPILKSITKTTKKHSHLTPYSHSRLTDMSQCPTFGVVHRQRRYSGSFRAMALEAGHAMHEVFAAIRIWQLLKVQKLPKHAQVTGERIFNKERWKECTSELNRYSDEREQLLDLSYKVLHTSAFYEDPRDDIRTFSNMEVAALRYIDVRLPLMSSWLIYVEDKKKPEGLIGIEQVFDVILTFSDNTIIRYIGTIDGLSFSTYHKKNFLDENKTASRLDEGWRQSFEMSHQVTGYCACSSAVFGFTVFDAHIIGIKIKPTGREDYHNFTVPRHVSHIQHWASWVYRRSREYEIFKDDFENAERYTHSCNRYFRPCILIPFCADTPEGRLEQWNEMEPAELSPSEYSVMEQF